MGMFVVAEIPPDYLLVLADNRPDGNDSRFYGLVSERQVVGQVIQ